jgi:alkylated DNA nucleotide flippase Atl1
MAERDERLVGSTLARLANTVHVDWHAVGTSARAASAGSVTLFSKTKADARSEGDQRVSRSVSSWVVAQQPRHT